MRFRQKQLQSGQNVSQFLRHPSEKNDLNPPAIVEDEADSPHEKPQILQENDS